MVESKGYTPSLRQCSPDLGRVLGQFGELLGPLCNKVTGPVPEVFSDPPSDLKELKTLLTRPIESLGANVSERQVSVAASMFLFRKCLPSPPHSGIPSYVKKLSREPEMETGFVQLAEEAISHLFKDGWDSRWAEYVERVVPSSGACTEYSRSKGGATRWAREELDREALVRGLLGFSDTIDISSERHVIELEDGGKKRIVTVASGAQIALQSLHQIIYDVLVSSGAVLRGEATEKSMKGMCRSREVDEKEEVFVSGDYESATDNFNAAHSKCLLRVLAKTSRKIPSSVWDVAILSLSGDLTIDRNTWAGLSPDERKELGARTSVQNTGQLMGNYLSFPLLCLTNILTLWKAFGKKWFKEKVKRGLVKINGDDIVFRATKEEFELWVQAVSFCGLTLSRGKTLVHKRIWSLNSTFFRSDASRVKLIPVIRSKSVYSPSTRDAGKPALISRIQAAIKSFGGILKKKLMAILLRQVIKRWTGGSLSGGFWGPLSKDFGFTADCGILEKASRALVKREREMRYLHLVAWDMSSEDNRVVVVTAVPDSILSEREWRSYPKALLDDLRPKQLRALELRFAADCRLEKWQGNVTVGNVDEPKSGFYRTLRSTWSYTRLLSPSGGACQGDGGVIQGYAGLASKFGWRDDSPRNRPLGRLMGQLIELAARGRALGLNGGGVKEIMKRSGIYENPKNRRSGVGFTSSESCMVPAQWLRAIRKEGVFISRGAYVRNGSGSNEPRDLIALGEETGDLASRSLDLGPNYSVFDNTCPLETDE